MGIHHLLSIDEDQLRNWQGDPNELLRNIGSAVVLACLDPGNTGVTIHADNSQDSGDTAGDSLTVVHVLQHECDEFAVWVWASGDDVCLADLPKDDLVQLGKLVSAVLQGDVIDTGEQ